MPEHRPDSHHAMINCLPWRTTTLPVLGWSITKCTRHPRKHGLVLSSRPMPFSLVRRRTYSRTYTLSVCVQIQNLHNSLPTPSEELRRGEGLQELPQILFACYFRDEEILHCLLWVYSFHVEIITVVGSPPPFSVYNPWCLPFLSCRTTWPIGSRMRLSRHAKKGATVQPGIEDVSSHSVGPVQLEKTRLEPLVSDAPPPRTGRASSAATENL